MPEQLPVPDELPAASPDEPRGDLGDQASRLQLVEEQTAIAAALAGDVTGSDAIEDRSPIIDPLEGPDPLAGQAGDSRDDPFYGGGATLTDPGEAALHPAEDAAHVAGLEMTGLAEDGAVMALDEGSTLSPDQQDRSFGSKHDLGLADFDPAELVEDQGVLADDLDRLIDVPAAPVDESAAEDLDALLDVLDLGHDLDDPNDPDGYGVPPDPGGGAAALDQAQLRDPVAGGEIPPG